MTGWALWLWLQAAGAGAQLFHELAPDPFAMLWLAPDPYLDSVPVLEGVLLPVAAPPHDFGGELTAHRVELAPSPYDLLPPLLELAPSPYDGVPSANELEPPWHELLPSPYEVSPISE